MKKALLLLLSIIWLLSTLVYAAEPPKDPILRIETGVHMGGITAIDIDRSNRWLVSVSVDKTLKVWNLESGNIVRTIRPPIAHGHEGKLQSVAISPDGLTIACSGWTTFGSDVTRVVYIFNRETGEMVARITDLLDAAKSIRFSPDGRFLAVAQESKGLRLYRTADWIKIAEDREYGDQSRSIHFSNDNRLVTTSYDGLIRLYRFDVSKNLPLQLLAKRKVSSNNRLFDACFSPDATKIAVGVIAGNIVVLSSSDLSELQSIDMPDVTEKKGSLSVLAWSADGRFLFAGGSNPKLSNGKWRHYIRYWDNAGRGNHHEFEASRGAVMRLQTFADNKVVFASSDPVLGIFNYKEGRSLLASPATADFEEIGDAFRLSKDGAKVGFGYDKLGQSLSSFSVVDRLLTPDNVALANGLPPISDINYSSQLRHVINAPITLYEGETIMSIANASDGSKIIWGSQSRIVCLGSSGQLWEQPIPGVAWSINISQNGRVVAAALDDGSIRWYQVVDGKELVALFPHADKKRWVLWTPEGFFDHSPGAEDLIGFHLNQGKDKAAEFIPVSKLYNQFYRPDLVTASFEGKDISGFAKAIDINRILSSKTLPPKVRLITQSATTEKPETEIAAEICDNGGGIGDVTLYLNNMPIAVESNGRGLKAQPKQHEACYKFTRSLTLGNGNNLISLMAYNRDNTIESDRPSVTIHHTSNFSGKPNLHILTVAVDSYRDGDLHLKYSKADAKGLAELLRSKASGLFESINLHTLSDAEVTKDRLDATFSAIGQKVRRQDMFILFVAGHGITYSKDGSFYFLPVNFRYSQDDDIPRQGVSMDDFKKYLAKIQASKSLLLLDTCNSGSFAEAIASRGLLEKTAINKLTRAVGRHTIVASSKSQVALEGFQGHGAFSYVLLDGMKGRAANNKGQITVNSLVSFVETELPELTYKKWGYEQIPQKSLVGEDFAIGISR